MRRTVAVQLESSLLLCYHYYTNDFARHPPGGHRGGHLFLPVTVNATVYLGGHFLFTTAGIFARHGKSIYRGGRLKMSATENTLFSAADILRRPPW